MSTAAVTAPQKKKKKRNSKFKQVVKRLLKNPVSVIGLIVLVILILVSIFAPLLAPYSPSEMDVFAAKTGPSAQHWFGCDQLGRDIFSRCLYGGRWSLTLGFAGALTGVFFGLLIGSLVGYVGGEVDNVAMRICDILTSIPGNLIAILLSTALGSGFIQTVIALSVGGIPHQVRGVRAMCLKEREQEYLIAAKSINCSKAKIMYKHMLPNIIAPSIVSTTLGIGGTIQSAAGLSYIGLGIQAGTPEWGAMLSGAKTYVTLFPHMLIFPGLFIAITVLATNMFGEGLRDALDPKLKN
ncbi:MAG: ABC transporter permease [Oscillospiraceae bacterium]